MVNISHEKLKNSLTDHPEVSMEGLLIIDQNFQIIAINAKAKKLLNIEKKELNRADIRQIITLYKPSTLSILDIQETPYYKALVNQIDSRETIAGIKLSKNIKWLSFTCKLISEDGLSNLLISLFDVSKIVNQNVNLIESKDQLKLLMASINDLVFEVSAEGVFKNYWTNHPELLFYDPSYFLEKSLLELFPGELSETTLELIKKTIITRKVSTLEFPSPAQHIKDGWYKLMVKPIYKDKNKVALVISDISKKVDSQEQIRLNEHKFNQAFQHSGLGTSLTNIEGKCIETNKILPKILGYSKAALADINFYAITHPDDLENDLKKRAQLITGDFESVTLEKRYLHAQGYYIWCSVTISAVKDTNQDVLFFIVQLHDISEERKNKAILERQKNELEIIKTDLESKINQVEEFNQIVAHNLRGPLSNIQMLINEIKDESNKEYKTQYLDLLQTSSESLIETFQELADVLENRKTMLIPAEQCNFEAVFKKVSNQFLGEINRKKALITTAFNIENILYPKVFLESILNNLLSNSLKYVAAGKIPRIEIKTYTENNCIYLHVEDNGLGIDTEKHKSQLFKFKKIFHPGYDSRGIGLFMTKYQVESLGGEITVESTPNIGSIFLVKF